MASQLINHRKIKHNSHSASGLNFITFIQRMWISNKPNNMTKRWFQCCNLNWNQNCDQTTERRTGIWDITKVFFFWELCLNKKVQALRIICDICLYKHHSNSKTILPVLENNPPSPTPILVIWLCLLTVWNHVILCDPIVNSELFLFSHYTCRSTPCCYD